MDRNRFVSHVENAVETIPETFSKYLENVVFMVEHEPDDETLDSMGIEYPEELLGLYQGDPLTERSMDAWGMLPDRIVLYQRPIELYAAEFNEPLISVIRDTILHEVGHFFGLTEEELERMGLD